MNQQQTVLKNIEFKGQGLHTGNFVNMSIKPAKEDFGIYFKRIDCSPPILIKVDISNVKQTLRGTTLSKSNENIHTIEHLLSALYALQIDNALIEIDGDEIPILDGSSKIFVEKILASGIKKLDKEAEYIEISEPIESESSNGKSKIKILPYNGYKISFSIDFENELIGKQSYILESLDGYVKNISESRTFCTIDEVLSLRSQGLIKGGNSDNAIIFSDSNTDNNKISKIKDLYEVKNNNFLTTDVNQLRCADEPVRHKILDVIGDLSLLGKRIKGHIISEKSGHALNIELAKIIKNKYLSKTNQSKFGFQFTKKEIEKIIPHRYPFLLIDEIIDGKDGEYVVSKKNVNKDEFYFQGHFPGRHIMPGVLILECMAQTSCFLDMKTTDNRNNKLMLLSIVKSAKFMKEVVPGDQLIIKTNLIKYKMGTARVQGIATVNDDVVATAEWMATLVNR